MAYINNSLGPNEKVIAQAKPHWINLISPLWVFVLGVLLIFVGGLGLLIIIGQLICGGIYMATTDLAVTNKKVIAKWGLISRKTIEQRLSKVDAVLVDQGVIGRLFNYGNLHVQGSGLASTPINRISNPILFRRQVELAEEENESA